MSAQRGKSGRAVAHGMRLGFASAVALAMALALAGCGSTRMGGRLHARSFGSDVRLAEAPEGGSVMTFGGDVRIGAVGGSIRAMTFGGDVELDTLGGGARIATFGGKVVLGLTPEAQGQLVSIRTFGGDVRLAIDPALGAAVDIEQVSQRGEESHIESDFPLDESVGPWRHRLFSGTRRTVHARGTIGGGGTRIRVRTFGGDVTLTRAAPLVVSR